MQYESVRFDDGELIGYVGCCCYEINECQKYEKVLCGLVCSNCFVWYCYDLGIKCNKTRNVVELLNL